MTTISSKFSVGISMTSEQSQNIENFVAGATKIKTFECEGRNYSSGVNKNTVEVYKLQSGELAIADNHTMGLFNATILGEEPVYKGSYSTRFSGDYAQNVKATKNGFEVIEERLYHDNGSNEITILQKGNFNE